MGDEEAQALAAEAVVQTAVDAEETRALAAEAVVQAAVDDARARLGVWKALLALPGVQGELSQFLQLVRSSASSPDIK